MKQIKDSSLIWTTDDVLCNMTEEMRNSKKWTDEELLDLGEEFFESQADWLAEMINTSMYNFFCTQDTGKN